MRRRKKQRKTLETLLPKDHPSLSPFRSRGSGKIPPLWGDQSCQPARASHVGCAGVACNVLHACRYNARAQCWASRNRTAPTGGGSEARKGLRWGVVGKVGCFAGLMMCRHNFCCFGLSASSRDSWRRVSEGAKWSIAPLDQQLPFKALSPCKACDAVGSICCYLWVSYMPMAICSRSSRCPTSTKFARLHCPSRPNSFAMIDLAAIEGVSGLAGQVTLVLLWSASKATINMQNQESHISMEQARFTSGSSPVRLRRDLRISSRLPINENEAVSTIAQASCIGCTSHPQQD